MAVTLGYRTVERVSQLLPISAGYTVAKGATRIGWQLCPKVRGQVCQNLAQLLGGRPDQFGDASQEVFCNFGYYLFELFAMHRMSQISIAAEGLEYLESARQANRGVITLTAHLGNWELAAKALQSMGYLMSAVALPHADARLDALFNEHRKRAGVEIIPLNQNAMRASLKALASGRLLGLLADRVYGGDGIPVTMGTGRMLIPKGPAVLSLRAQAPIVPTFLVREGMWRFRLICKQVLWPTMEKPAVKQVETLVVAYAKILEDVLKRYSRQWLMFEPVFQIA